MKDVFVITRHRIDSPEYTKILDERQERRRMEYESKLTPEYLAFLEGEVARMLRNKKGD